MSHCILAGVGALCHSDLTQSIFRPQRNHVDYCRKSRMRKKASSFTNPYQKFKFRENIAAKLIPFDVLSDGICSQVYTVFQQKLRRPC